MVAHHAAILDHDLSRGAGLLRRAFVPDSKLHPDHLPGTFDRLIDDRKDVGRRTKDVDRVVGDRHSIEGRLGLLSKDLRGGGVHRDVPVSVLLIVLGDSVGVLCRFFATTDHGNRPEALTDQGARRILAWHHVPSEGIPHARKTDGAGPLPQEHPPTLHDEARRRDMDHTGAKARRGYASFGSARFANPKLLSLNNDNTEGRGNLTALSIRVPLPNIQAAFVRWADRWMRSPRRLRSACAHLPSSES